MSCEHGNRYICCACDDAKFIARTRRAVEEAVAKERRECIVARNDGETHAAPEVCGACYHAVVQDLADEEASWVRLRVALERAADALDLAASFGLAGARVERDAARAAARSEKAAVPPVPGQAPDPVTHPGGEPSREGVSSNAPVRGADGPEPPPVVPADRLCECGHNLSRHAAGCSEPCRVARCDCQGFIQYAVPPPPAPPGLTPERCPNIFEAFPLQCLRPVGHDGGHHYRNTDPGAPYSSAAGNESERPAPCLASDAAKVSFAPAGSGAGPYECHKGCGFVARDAYALGRHAARCDGAHACGGPREACAEPGCIECGAPSRPAAPPRMCRVMSAEGYGCAHRDAHPPPCEFPGNATGGREGKTCDLTGEPLRAYCVVERSGDGTLREHEHLSAPEAK
jgi:hypothetical protein